MKKKIYIILALIVATAIFVTGCSSKSDTSSMAQNNIDIVESASTVTTEASTIAVDTEFTAKDLEVGYEETTATRISLNGSNILVSGDGVTVQDTTVKIVKEGSYVISGTLDNGQILVDAGDSDKLQLILDNAAINCNSSAPIYIKNADKVFLTLENGTQNTLTDGTEYIQNDDNTVDGTIYSTSDLTLNGSGMLTINANYKHGIVSKDDLVITGGTYQISAVKDALNGKDCVKIRDGEFVLTSVDGNGIQSKNGEDTTKGYIYISGGSISIPDCQEGLEGTAIVIAGGEIDIHAEDDGLNASSGSSNSASSNNQNNGRMDNPFENDTNCYISISGGTLTVDAQGDGIDSNGSLYVLGGSVFVSGPTEAMNSSLDYNGDGQITGGTVIAVGSLGMAQGFSDTSTQYSLINNLSASVEANSEVSLKDSDGNIIVSYTPVRQYQSVVISSPELKEGETYTLTCGSQTAEVTLSSIVTSNGQQGNKMPGNGRPPMGNMHGGGMRGGEGPAGPGM